MGSTRLVRLAQEIESLGRRIWDDVTNLRHLEKYLVAFFAIILSIANLGVDISDKLLVSVALTTLGMLVFGLTRPEPEENGLDAFLNNRDDLPDLKDMLKSTNELWVYAPSGANLLRGDYLGTIVDNILKKKNGHLRVMIQNPAKGEAVRILIEHLDKGVVEQNNQAMPDEITLTKEQLEKMSSGKHGDEVFKGKLSYGFINYGLGFSILLFNPERVNGHIILEIHGYRNKNTRSRMHIVISRRESETWYEYWKDQMTEMWGNAEGKFESA